jgi:hypothetical protein
MLAAFISHIASQASLSDAQARSVLGLFLDAADRQGAGLARTVFEAMPGARTLAAEMSAESGGTTGSIARLIERTPGGRVVVVEKMMRSLHALGLGTQQIGAVFPAISGFLETEFGAVGYGHLGDLLASPSIEALAAQAPPVTGLQMITAR